jgi:diguanylate cyclase
MLEPRNFDLSSLRRPAVFAALGILGCAALAVILNYFLLFGSFSTLKYGMLSALLLSLVITGPLVAAVAWQADRIHRLNQRLGRLATYDGATEFYRPAVFSSMIELRRNRPGATSRRGALLMIRIEDLVTDSARFGFAWKDQVLQHVASTIRNAVRRDDLVGRTGDGEFAVFLPGATEANARDVGERILAAVRSAYVTRENQDEPLSVRVGGVVFEKQLEFGEMFKAAADEIAGGSKNKAAGLKLASLKASVGDHPNA